MDVCLNANWTTCLMSSMCEGCAAHKRSWFRGGMEGLHDGWVLHQVLPTDTSVLRTPGMHGGHSLRGSQGRSGFVPVHPRVALGHGARLECTLGLPLRVPEGLVVLRGPGAECTLWRLWEDGQCPQGRWRWLSWASCTCQCSPHLEHRTPSGMHCLC